MGTRNLSTETSVQRIFRTRIFGSVTGIFVSKLDARTSTRQIQSHLQRETGIRLKPEQLKSKYNTYASFYIPCGQDVRRRLLDRDLWPKGSLVKPFYN